MNDLHSLKGPKNQVVCPIRANSSLILSRVDYCNALLHGAPTISIQKLEHVQSIATRIVLQVPRQSDSTPLLCQLHWLPVWQRITYKLACWHSGSAARRHLPTSAVSSQHASVGALYVPLQFRWCPYRSTRLLSQDTFRCTAPTTWNSLSNIVTAADSLASFKSRLKTHLFNQTFRPTCS